MPSINEIESLKQHYETQIEHLRQRAIHIDNVENNIDIESYYYHIKELQDKNFANQVYEKCFETLSHSYMQKLMNFEIYLKDLLKHCQDIRTAKNQNPKKKKESSVESNNNLYDLLAIIQTKEQELKENLMLAKTDLERIIKVSRLMQKNSELVNLLTLKLGKKQLSTTNKNGILQDISMNARQVVKTLEGISAGLQNAMECISQKYEQLQIEIGEIATL